MENFLEKYTRFMTKDIYIKYDLYANFLKQYSYLYEELDKNAILFRENMCEPCNDLYDAGYIDKKDYALIGNVLTKLRFSEYLPFEKVSEIIFRLREFYDVGYYEATYYYNDKVMFFNYYGNRNIVRIFPLEDYKKMDKLEQLKVGIIYVRDGTETYLENVDDVFEYLPTVVNSNEYCLDEETRKKREQIEKEWNEIISNSSILAKENTSENIDEKMSE